MAESRCGRRGRRRGHGEGSVRRRPDGLWEVSIELPSDASGKRRRRYATAKTQQLAIEKLAKLRLALGVNAEYGSARFEHVFGNWLKQKAEQVRPKTFETYSSTAAKWVVPYFGRSPVGKINRGLVGGWLSWLESGGAPYFAKVSGMKLLKSFFRWAVEYDYCSKSPVAFLRRPESAAVEWKPLQVPEVQRLLAACRERQHGDVVIVALGTGMRAGEVLGLCWDAVDFDHSLITVRRTVTAVRNGASTLVRPKTEASRRTIHCPGFVMDALRQRRSSRFTSKDADGPVFLSRRLKLFRRCYFSSDFFKKLLRDAGLREGFRFHDLRHTHASILLSQGRSVKEVAQRLGHRDPAITLRVYAHLMAGDSQQTVQVLDRMLGSASGHSAEA